MSRSASKLGSFMSLEKLTTQISVDAIFLSAHKLQHWRWQSHVNDVKLINLS